MGSAQGADAGSRGGWGDYAMSYVLRSVRASGTITYHCASTHSALEKLHDFQRAEYANITITTSDEREISERQLIALMASEARG